MFTPKELKVAKMKLEGLMNNKIAETLKVSEADISQTLSRLSRKVKTVQDSTKLLMDIGMIQEGPKYVMTEEGRKLTRLPEKQTSVPTQYGFMRISTVTLETKGLVEISRAVYAAPYRLLVLGEGTRTTVPKISGTSTHIPSAKPLTILLTKQQTQSTKLSQ